MNSAKAIISDFLKPTLLQAAGLMVGAVVVGMVYNSVSPLGVQAAAESIGPPVATVVTNTQPQVVRSAPRAATTSTYNNETIAMRLEPVGGVQPTVISPPNSPTPVRNPPPPPTVPAGAHDHGDIAKLTWTEVKPLLLSGQIVLVDARSPAHFQAGHIPGAISLPLTGGPGAMTDFGAKYPRTAQLVVYCGSSTCPMGHKLAEKLFVEYGFVNVSEMPGGYAEYRQAKAREVQR